MAKAVAIWCLFAVGAVVGLQVEQDMQLMQLAKHGEEHNQTDMPTCSSIDGSDISDVYPCACGSTVCNSLPFFKRSDWKPYPASEVCTAATHSCSRLACKGDSTIWRSDFGPCDSFARGRSNRGFCEDDGAAEFQGLRAYMVCEECEVCVRATTGQPTASPTGQPTGSPTERPTAAPTPAPTHPSCSVTDGSDVSEEYPCACGPSLCTADMTGRADFLPRPGSLACNAGSCTQLECVGDDTKWRSDHGDCASYGEGSRNQGFCTDEGTDEDNRGLKAYRVCRECQVCFRPPSPAPTPLPTASPTAEPTAAPTPSPTERPWEQLKHNGSAQVACLSLEGLAVAVSSKYECLVSARDLEHSYFQFSPSGLTCQSGESCEVVPTTEDFEVYADPLASFAVAGSAKLTLALPSFLLNSNRRLPAPPPPQAREEQEQNEQKSEFQCLDRKAGCTAKRVDLQGRPFVPMDLLEITGGESVKVSTDIASCPLGWKIFSPTSQRDWESVQAAKIDGETINLEDALVDISSEDDSVDESPTESEKTKKWRTLDRSKWFLRPDANYRPTGRYRRNCLVRITSAARANDIQFQYKCNRGTTRYFCQRQEVVPFSENYETILEATQYLADVIRATRNGLEAPPCNLDSARLLVSGHTIIFRGDDRRLAAGDIDVITTFNVAATGAEDANALDAQITNTVSDPSAAAAIQQIVEENENMTVTNATLAEPQVQVDPPPPTPAPTRFPTSSPTPVPTASPTESPTPFPTPPPRTHSPTGSPTLSPTNLPSAAPTEPEASSSVGNSGGSAPPVAPSPSPGVSANGDPHLTNVLSQRFDLMMPGVHMLLQIPRAARPEQTFLRVDADAWALGGACADMYFQALNVTGTWAATAAGGGLSFSVAAPPKTQNTGWIAVGKVDLKVVWGHTVEGIRYLNMYARHLTKTGYPVGGLLGEDDHTKESTPPANCKAYVALQSSREQPEAEAQVGSIAEGM